MLGINKLLAFLRRQVGLRTDAASATGSLHAKIKDIADNKLQTATGTSAHTRANNTVMGWLNTQVKSIQRGTAIITEPNVSATATISGVTTGKSVVVLGHMYPNASAAGVGLHACLANAVLTNTTTITFTRGVAGGTVTIAWQVIELY